MEVLVTEKTEYALGDRDSTYDSPLEGLKNERLSDDLPYVRCRTSAWRLCVKEIPIALLLLRLRPAHSFVGNRNPIRIPEDGMVSSARLSPSTLDKSRSNFFLPTTRMQ